MLTEGQLAVRRSGVTATDVRVLVLGADFGRTPHDVWLDKRGLSAPWSGNESTSLGDELEPIIIRRTAERVGLHVLPRDPGSLTLRHPTKPRHIATPDALLGETRLSDPTAGTQVKLVGVMPSREWGPVADGAEAIPEPVFVQVAWELHVTALPVIYVGALVGTQLQVYPVTQDDVADLVPVLEEEADRFLVDHVDRGVPPEVDGSAGARRMLRAVYPRNLGNLVLAGADAEGLAREYFDAKRVRDEADKRVELAGQQLSAIAGNADGLTGDGWRLLLRWREPVELPASRREGYRHFDMRPVKAKGAKAA